MILSSAFPLIRIFPRFASVAPVCIAAYGTPVLRVLSALYHILALIYSFPDFRKPGSLGTKKTHGTQCPMRSVHSAVTRSVFILLSYAVQAFAPEHSPRSAGKRYCRKISFCCGISEFDQPEWGRYTPNASTICAHIFKTPLGTLPLYHLPPERIRRKKPFSAPQKTSKMLENIGNFMVLL